MKKDIVKNIITNLKKKGATEIRGGGTGQGKPKALSFNGNRKSYTPDLVAFYGNKRDIFSIEKKIVKSELSNLIAKWILFGLEARRHGGQFYLVVEEKHEDKCKTIIEQKQLSVELMTY